MRQSEPRATPKEGFLKLASFTNPKLTVVDVGFGPNRGFGAAEGTSKDHSSEVDSYNTHSVTLRRTVRGGDPVFGEGVAYLEFPLKSREETRSRE